MKRWKHRPDGSTWGDWGEDDQLGRLNLITSKKVLEGVAEVREGRSFCLSLPLDFPGGNVLTPRATHLCCRRPATKVLGASTCRWTRSTRYSPTC